MRQVMQMTWLAIALLVCSTGCGGPKTYPVKGTIQFTDGQPAKELARGTVIFETSSGSPAVTARGHIRDDGSFQVGTNSAEDGALPGTYKVLIMPPGTTLDPDDPPSPPVIHPRYEKFATSGLTATVESKSNEITFKVERAKKK